MALKHGGNLLAIAKAHRTDPRDWLDLSTGVSPYCYPIPPIPADVWNQLPQVDDGLEQAAANYYRSPVTPLTVAGSQAAIMNLPLLLSNTLPEDANILLPKVGYKEHQHAWQQHAETEQPHWHLSYYDDFPTAQQVANASLVLLINPNNPSGCLLSKRKLMQLLTTLRQTGGYLIVDEAFMDTTPEESMISEAGSDNLIILRSVGKFFGMAGARVGFVFAAEPLKTQLTDLLGPWTVAGPSRYVMQQALRDSEWQQAMRDRLNADGARLKRLLAEYLPEAITGTALFARVSLTDAKHCHQLLCQQQILTRLCDEGDTIRFGLPQHEADWQRLALALQHLSESRNQHLAVASCKGELNHAAM